MLFNPIGELYNLYNRLLERDMVPPFGYVDAPVHAVFVLSDTGDLKEIVPAYTLVKTGAYPLNTPFLGRQSGQETSWLRFCTILSAMFAAFPMTMIKLCPDMQTQKNGGATFI